MVEGYLSFILWTQRIRWDVHFWPLMVCYLTDGLIGFNIFLVSQGYTTFQMEYQHFKASLQMNRTLSSVWDISQCIGSLLIPPSTLLLCWLDSVMKSTMRIDWWSQLYDPLLAWISCQGSMFTPLIPYPSLRVTFNSLGPWQRYFWYSINFRTMDLHIPIRQLENLRPVTKTRNWHLDGQRCIY